jgi:cation-transporting P-type ATPase 13A2
MDITAALSSSRRARRDSQYSMAYEESGSMFDGPGHAVVPSSVSRMSHRRSLSRRRSGEVPQLKRRASGDSSRSIMTEGEDGGDPEEGDVVRRGRKSPSPARRGVFGSISHLFSGDAHARRRPSISQYSTTSSRRRGSDRDEDEEERWGYSSGEEDESEEEEQIVRTPSPMGSAYGSLPPSPTRSAMNIPLMSDDRFFGEDTRIDIEFDEHDARTDGGLSSKQMMHLRDEDMTVRVVGHEIIIWRARMWRGATLLSLGTLGLLGHWFPKLWLHYVTREKAFGEIGQGYIVVEVCVFQIIYVGMCHQLQTRLLIEMWRFSLLIISNTHTRRRRCLLPYWMLQK